MREKGNRVVQIRTGVFPFIVTYKYMELLSDKVRCSV